MFHGQDQSMAHRWQYWCVDSIRRYLKTFGQTGGFGNLIGQWLKKTLEWTRSQEETKDSMRCKRFHNFLSKKRKHKRERFPIRKGTYPICISTSPTTLIRKERFEVDMSEITAPYLRTHRLKSCRVSWTGSCDSSGWHIGSPNVYRWCIWATSCSSRDNRLLYSGIYSKYQTL